MKNKKEKSPLTSKKLYVVGFPRHPWVYGPERIDPLLAVKGSSLQVFVGIKQATDWALDNMSSEGAKCNIYELVTIKQIVA